MSLPRLRRISPRAILVGGSLGFLLYAFPGYMSWDSMTQLAQARRDYYTDDHPPAMAVLWHVLEHVLHGPLPMLLVQTVPFVAGVYYLFATRLAPRTAALAAVALLWFPPIGTVVATLFKDATMAAFLVAALPLLISPRGPRRAWGLALLGAGTAMRYNALAATLPLVVLLYRYGALAGWRRYAAAFAAWLAITGAALVADRALVDHQKHYWSSTQALMDIADTLAVSRDYSDAELAQLLDGVPLAVHDQLQERLRTLYQPVDFRHLDRGANQIFIAPRTEAERDAVGRAWHDVIAANPAAYARYRWDNFVMLMRLDHATYFNAPVTFVLYWHEDYDFLDYDMHPSRVQVPLLETMKAISRTHLFDPYPYAILALLLLAAAIARRDRLAAALLLSGLGYQAAWLLLAPTADYRYSEWMVAMTLAAAVTLAARLRARATRS